MKGYDHAAIEEKWQRVWEQSGQYSAARSSHAKKYYVLAEFPYPSGEGLHNGHVRGYTAMDVIARKRRAEGYNVLYPMGWDSFGLPTENYAIKTGIHPSVITKRNTDTFRRQLKSLGFSFDWSREVNTSDPGYYRWTQWIFLQLLKKGLAYKATKPINWCLSCKIGLANEEVVDGRCERCGGETEKRNREQWMLAITKYADRLDRDLDGVDFPDRVKIMQREWIGRSEGAEIDFPVKGGGDKVTIFTTRPDTLFGVTYLVVAPEHRLVSDYLARSVGSDEVRAYVSAALKRSDIDRLTEGKSKSGVRLENLAAVNPASGEELPVFVADYVLGHYGTGAVMAVPAHDSRDYAFAKEHGLPIKTVIDPGPGGQLDAEGAAYLGTGNLVNSGKFNGQSSEAAGAAIVASVRGRTVTRFKLQDWVFSRQRYWGEPIPVIRCQQCGLVPVPEEDLPVELPEVENYKPTETGESPLATMTSWVNVECPRCKSPAERETDTMPNWAGSSWYFLRYTDPTNRRALASAEALKEWLPVDWYNGGMEHTTLHLLYSRFWHKFLFDIGVVPTTEPYAKRSSHGFILAQDGAKMSKSRGNVINPDEVVKTHGADTLRLYEMFVGPFDQAVVWSTESIVGVRRFIERVWLLRGKLAKGEGGPVRNQELEVLMHQTVKKVGDDIEALKLNTVVSQLMIFTNALEKEADVTPAMYRTLVRLMAPFTPHVCEELWEAMGNLGSVHAEAWPTYDPAMLAGAVAKVAVQINGKVRAIVQIAPDAAEADALAAAAAQPEVKKWLADHRPGKVVYIPGKIINFVI